MKKIIVYLLLAVLFGIMFSLSFAQQDQIRQSQDLEVESLKKRISELESKLQTVENVEKMELAAKLADANANLRNSGIDKFKRELKDTNDEWLREWSLWFLTIIGIFVAILLGVSYVFWYWLKTKADQLIIDEVKKSLNRFKEAVDQVNILKNQIRILEKENAASVLGNSMSNEPEESIEAKLYFGSEQIKVLPEQAILDVFNDDTRSVSLRCNAADVLANRKSIQLVSPLLAFLNSSVNSKRYDQAGSGTKMNLCRLVYCLVYVPTLETYVGLTEFLNRLITENPRHRDLFLTITVFSLASVSVELNRRDSLSILKRTVSF